MNLIATFLETAGRMGERPAVVSGDGARIGYGALAARSAAAASAWRAQGIGRGDRVLVAMPVGVDLYVAIAALWRLGATIVFPEPAMGLSGLKHAVAMTGPKAVLTAGWYRLLPFVVPALWPVRLRLSMPAGEAGEPILEEVEADHPALISFTSGSTGAPKGIERSHGFLAAQNACVAHMLASDRDEIDLVAFPVFVIANLSMGTTSVLPDWKPSRYEDATADGIAALIRREKVTRALLPPSICETMAEGEVDPGLRAIFTGGGPIFPDLMQKLRGTMPATSIMMVYGSTEAEPISHQRVEDISPEQWRTMERGAGLLAGRPVEETRLRIIDDEIVVTGDHVNKTYLGGRGDAENKLRIDGEIWHRTGDAGRLDGDGNLWLRGRLSAKAGAFYPFEVEVAARAWPGVRRAALVPDVALLALEGDEPEAGLWEEKAKALGVAGIVRLDAIPLDRRHRSKVDYAQLRRLAVENGASFEARCARTSG